MHVDPFQALQAASRPLASAPARQELLIAGATGVMGNEMVRRLVGNHRFATTHVLTREPIRAGLNGVMPILVHGAAPGQWPVVKCGGSTTGLIMFDPPRLFNDRERALWTPLPEQLPELAIWMQRCGVQTLAIVLPHAQGRLPEALKRGLASLDEHAVAALGFERLLIVRSAQKPGKGASGLGSLGMAQRAAHLMLSSFNFMVPSSEQPVRAVKVAEFVDEALAAMPPGIHIAAPERVWQAAQGNARHVVREWLGRREAQSTAK